VSIAAAAGFLLLVVVLLLGYQRSLIYFPQTYTEFDLRIARQTIVEVPYATSMGEHTAYYVPPREGPLQPDGRPRPNRLWVVFGGNGMVALDWLEFTAAYPDPHAAFLLVDYPGYGINPGRPKRSTIVETATIAIPAAQIQCGLDDNPTTASIPIGLLGASLGCAAALEMPGRVNPDRVVLVAPFTSLLAMARGTVGWPLCYLLLDRFDNAARLNELAARSPRLAVTIIHGTADQIIPFEHGQSLAAAHPDWIAFHAVENGDHNWILQSARPLIFQSMLTTDSTTD
jgi:pimeloyl-ACP methyl ester carboxylesterase